MYELGNYGPDHKYYMYEISLIIIVLCMIILIRVSIMLTTTTSHISFIAVILAPMLSVFMEIDSTDLYYAHEFQAFMIGLNMIFHLVTLCMNIDQWISILCFMSFLDGLCFIIIVTFLLSMTSPQKNKLLYCNILLEIVLLLFAVIIIGLNRDNSSLILFNFTLFGMINYVLFNIPFLKSYFLYQFMYKPSNESVYNYIITNSKNNMKQIIHRFYARIHCMSHKIKWKWKWKLVGDINENTQLIRHLHLHNNDKQVTHNLKYHDMDSKECWRLLKLFMDLSETEKMDYVQSFINDDKEWKIYKILSIIYGVFSVIAYVYPILWLLLSNALFGGKQYGFYIENEYQSFVVWFIVIMYVTCLMAVILYGMRRRFFVYKAMIWYTKMKDRYKIHVDRLELMDCEKRMGQVKVIMDSMQKDIAELVLMYCYHRGDCEVMSNSDKEESISLYNTFAIYNSPPFVI